LILIVFVGRDV